MWGNIWAARAQPCNMEPITLPKSLADPMKRENDYDVAHVFAPSKYLWTNPSSNECGFQHTHHHSGISTTQCGLAQLCFRVVRAGK